jgi:pSer/pThr/pTyr-binding forkhead associated (FHA) protein
MDAAILGKAPKQPHRRTLIFRLKLRCRNLIVREYRLEAGDLRAVGRDPTKHIVIDDPVLSCNHACIVYLENQLLIWDERSKHGMFVNRVQLIGGQLKNGDVVSIDADYSLLVYVSVAEKDGDSTAVGDAWQKLTATR